MEAVLVTWHDAHGDSSGWLPIDSVDTAPCVVTSIGFALPSGTKPGHYSLAQSILHSDYIDHVLHIPLGMIVRVVTLD